MDRRNAAGWRAELPRLRGRTVDLREPTPHDLGPLIDLCSCADAPRFALDAPVTELAVQQFIGRAIRERAGGVSFSYVITIGAQRGVIGLFQVRQLDATFETAEWECMIAPSSRGRGVFAEAARLVASFTFNAVGAHRLESRVPIGDVPASGALRKIGAVQEGILRRSLRCGNEFVDQGLWAVVKDDWSDQWVPSAARVH
jgi:RimJ/RimL family protein N-acetyltransferase